MAAGMSADNVLRLRDCSKNEYLAEKRSFEGKYEILKRRLEEWKN